MAARASAMQHVGGERVGWSDEEDKKLFEYMERHGGDHQTRRIRWNDVSKGAGLKGRNGKACRLRWNDYLRPDIKKGPFTGDEEATIMELQKKHGNTWAMIAKQLPGRTETGIKNFWNTSQKKMKISKKETPGGRGSRGVVIDVTDASPVSNSPEEPEPSKAKANEAAGQSPSEMLLPAIANPMDILCDPRTEEHLMDDNEHFWEIYNSFKVLLSSHPR